MRTQLLGPLVAATLLVLAGLPVSASIVVDGGLGDWGVNPWPGTPTRDGGDWTPGIPVDGWWSEDFVGANGFVGPGWGGQNFDVEAMYSLRDANTLYFAMVTGFDQNGEWFNGTHYAAGALFYDFGNNGTWDIAIQLHNGPNSVVGNIYTGNDPVWWTDPTDFPSSGPFQVNTANASLIGTVNDFAYANNYGFAGKPEGGKWDHNIYELSFDVSAWLSDILNGGYSIHWTMECGNDIGYLVVPGEVIPEPATMTLLGLGISGLIARRRFARSAS